jgi:NAD(P)-dependent dehydrogenase (short-subunit alcohol dehydrogenase family)
MSGMSTRTAIVTGGGAGIGRAIAIGLAAVGCRIGLIDIDDRGMSETAKAMACGAQTRSVMADVGDGTAVTDAVDRLAAELGSLDILVNCAGILRFGTLESLGVDEWRETFRTNVDGVFHTSRAAIPHLRAGNSARIVNIASWLGKIGRPHFGAYCASKAAIISLTETLALELAPDRITVNAVCPGVITHTGMRDRAEIEARALGLPSAESRLAGIPLGRLGEPEDVAGVAVFLASEAAAYMTGHTVNVTGGLWLS